MGIELAGIEDLLLQEEHIVEIIPAESWGVPEIDYSVFKNESSAEFYAGLMKRFLSCDYIVDDFTDHNHDRRPWLHDMYAKHGRKVYDYLTFENALKRGNFAQISKGHPSLIDSLEEFYEGPEKGRMHLLSAMLKKQGLSLSIYDSLPSDSKIFYVHRFKSSVFAVLKFLSQVPAARKAS